jgi:uncharacterized protein
MNVKIRFSDDRIIAYIDLIKNTGNNLPFEAIQNSLAAKKFNFEYSKELVKEEFEDFVKSGKSKAKIKILKDEYLDVSGCFNVTVSDDELYAVMDINVPKNVCGKINQHFLKRVLKNANIAHGIILSTLNKIEKKYNKKSGKGENIYVARGDPEILAQDGYLILNELFDSKTTLERVKKEKGLEKIVEMSAITTKRPVPKGTVLITKVLPVYGKKGMTVTGRPLWSNDNKRNVVDPRIAVSKNVEVVDKEGIWEYTASVRGNGFFINGNMIEVEEVINGTFEVFINPDKMKGLLSFRAPSGGDQIKPDDVFKSIKEKKIKTPYNKQKLLKMINDINENRIDKIDRAVFTTGENPINGADARVLWVVNLETFYKPKVLPNGSVDYRGGGRFPFISKDKIAGVWMLRTKGVKDGCNILGEKIEAGPGKNLGIDWNECFGFRDTVYNKKKAKYLISKRSGLLNLKNNRTTIEPMVQLDTIDYSTGNIDFDGSIVIKESIKDGFTVKCSKDLIVKGALGACNVECGGDVFIQGGVNGRGKGIIKAGGNVAAKFVENTYVYSEKDICIKGYSLLSTLVSKNRVFVGTEKAKGKIIGGKIYAWESILTHFIGSEKSVADAEIWLGIDVDVNSRIKKLEQEILDLRQDIASLTNKKSKSDELQLIKAIETELAEKTDKLNKLMEENNSLQESLYNNNCEGISILGQAQAHTQIMIGPFMQKTHDKIEKSVFKLDKNKILMEKLQVRRR